MNCTTEMMALDFHEWGEDFVAFPHKLLLQASLTEGAKETLQLPVQRASRQNSGLWLADVEHAIKRSLF